MTLFAELRELDSRQRNIVLASFLGWTLDAFDYFLLIFVMPEVAKEFNVGIPEVAIAITLTLAMRPLGAFIFGRLADHFGRRPVMMADVALYSLLGLASAFAPSLAVLMVLRALFGVAMGGEWGIGASLAMESVPARARGAVSGLLQSGYPMGYLLAGALYLAVFDSVGWRGMFVAGALPALLVLYIRRKVPESPAWERQHATGDKPSLRRTMRGRWGLFFYMVALMTTFNMFSHGTQDLYPTFLKQQHHFGTLTVGVLATVLNLGAITGGLVFGAWSERLGRKRTIVIAALLALPVIPLWAYAPTPLLLGAGAFAIQFMVQGAWGVVPVHLNELSPDGVRGTLPGFAYQTGNLLASATAPFLAWFAAARQGDYGFAMAVFIAAVAILLALLTWLGPQAQGFAFGRQANHACAE